MAGNGLPLLSASKLKSFQMCSNRYYYRYIEHQQERKNIYAILGTAFHKSIERYYLHNENPFEAYEQVWWEELKKYHLEHDNKLFYDGADMLALYEYTERTPTYVEYEFRVPFPERNPICDLHGFMDHIYAEEDIVYDLKTSTRKPSKRALDTDLQFIIYAYAYRYLFKRAPTLVWYAARFGEHLVADVEGEEKEKMLYDVVQDVLAYTKNPKVHIVEKTCFYCPFIERCLMGEE